MHHLSPAKADSDAESYKQQNAKDTNSDLDCLDAGNAGGWLTPLCYSPWRRPPRGYHSAGFSDQGMGHDTGYGTRDRVLDMRQGMGHDTGYGARHRVWDTTQGGRRNTEH